MSRINLSEAERQEATTAWLAEIAEQSGLTNPPAVDVVRWTTTQSDYGEAHATCLQEAGFPAKHDGFGGTYFEPGVPADQTDALHAASYVCEAQYPPDPVMRQDWTTEQLTVLYDYWDQYFIPCMTAHDVHISTADQPSRDSFVAAFHTQARSSWWPSDHFWSLSTVDQDRLGSVCPPFPPDDVFYGS